MSGPKRLARFRHHLRVKFEKSRREQQKQQHSQKDERCFENNNKNNKKHCLKRRNILPLLLDSRPNWTGGGISLFVSLARLLAIIVHLGVSLFVVPSKTNSDSSLCVRMCCVCAYVCFCVCVLCIKNSPQIILVILKNSLSHFFVIIFCLLLNAVVVSPNQLNPSSEGADGLWRKFFLVKHVLLLRINFGRLVLNSESYFYSKKIDFFNRFCPDPWINHLIKTRKFLVEISSTRSTPSTTG